jgi:hypothetical protein
LAGAVDRAVGVRLPAVVDGERVSRTVVASIPWGEAARASASVARACTTVPDPCRNGRSITVLRGSTMHAASVVEQAPDRSRLGAFERTEAAVPARAAQCTVCLEHCETAGLAAVITFPAGP